MTLTRERWSALFRWATMRKLGQTPSDLAPTGDELLALLALVDPYGPSAAPTPTTTTTTEQP